MRCDETEKRVSDELIKEHEASEGKRCKVCNANRSSSERTNVPTVALRADAVKMMGTSKLAAWEPNDSLKYRLNNSVNEYVPAPQKKKPMNVGTHPEKNPVRPWSATSF